MPEPRPDLFISADIETDGPIPGEYSMLSFGLCLASRFDGSNFEVLEPRQGRSFYVEIKPISERFEPEALRVNGLDRDQLHATGEGPAEAMRAAASWVEKHAAGARPVLVAYPVAFDWAFLYWYFIRFTGQSPFGFSSCLDIRSFYQARALVPFDRASQQSMPEHLLARRKHTHHALDDAHQQAELFNNIFAWALRGGGGETRLAHRYEAPAWLEPLLDPLRSP